jgi:hypothetical protein
VFVVVLVPVQYTLPTPSRLSLSLGCLMLLGGSGGRLVVFINIEKKSRLWSSGKMNKSKIRTLKNLPGADSDPFSCVRCPCRLGLSVIDLLCRPLCRPRQSLCGSIVTKYLKPYLI